MTCRFAEPRQRWRAGLVSLVVGLGIGSAALAAPVPQGSSPATSPTRGAGRLRLGAAPGRLRPATSEGPLVGPSSPGFPWEPLAAPAPAVTRKVVLRVWPATARVVGVHPAALVSADPSESARAVAVNFPSPGRRLLDLDPGALLLRVDLLRAPGGARLTLGAAGFQSQELVLPCEAFSDGAAWPPLSNPPVALTPRYGWISVAAVWAQLHPVAASALGMGWLVGVSWAWRRRRRLQRAAHAAQEQRQWLEGCFAREGRLGPHSGSLLGGWRVLGMLGEGGAARVYRTVRDCDGAAGRPAAIKVMRGEGLAAGGWGARLQSELSALLSLQHPHVVRLEALGEQDGMRFLVFELVEGASLAERLGDGGQVPAWQAVRWLVQLAQALAAAHRRGIAHCDVKPANVLMRSDETVCLTDFGLAAVQAGDAHGGGESLHGERRRGGGTVGYMAPEVIEGQAPDARSDQYALGVLAYLLLSGEPPFGRGEPMAVFHRQLADLRKPLREQRPDLPDALCATVEGMLARRPEARFASLDEVARLLEVQGGAAALRTTQAAAP